MANPNKHIMSNSKKESSYLEKRLANDPSAQASNMESYYKFHALIYDLTRWSFLFGRKGILNKLPFKKSDKFSLLEVGCGTGVNLKALASRYPNAHLIGLDVSPDMIRQSTKKLAGLDAELVTKPYTKEDDSFKGKVDLVLFSYSLTMINPHWDELVLKAKEDLKPGGYIAVADFHSSPFQWFRTHMANNHVKMEGHINPLLRAEFEPVYDKVLPAYLGVWRYFMFIGRKS